MALALRPDTPVEKLVVLDMSPAVGQISPDFAKYLEAMKAIVAARVRSRKEADQILAKYEPVRAACQRGPAHTRTLGDRHPTVPAHEPRSRATQRPVRLPTPARHPHGRAGRDWGLPIHP